VLKLQGSVARATWAASPIAALLFAVCSPAQGAPNADYRVKDLEAELRATQARVVELQATLDTLAAGVAALKGESGSRQNTELKPPEQREPSAGGESIEGELRDAMLVPDLGRDERGNKLEAKPQLFVQTGFAADRIEGATRDDAATNFTLTRLEARWAGQVTEQLGMGFEIQYGPAPEGASEELVNDAFVEYYANDAVTLRLGQFVIPFGFDPQQSTSERESPERAMFVGYFFPGERDRGAMVAADLSSLGGWLEGMDLYGGVFNGNRFFDDDNNDLNVNLRVRKSFSDMPFAIGLSLQTGKQVVPPDATTPITDRQKGATIMQEVHGLSVRELREEKRTSDGLIWTMVLCGSPFFFLALFHQSLATLILLQVDLLTFTVAGITGRQ